MKIWNKALDIIKTELTEVTFKTWLEPLKPISFESSTLILETASEFDKSIIECRYIKLINTAMKSLGIENPNVIIETNVPCKASPCEFVPCKYTSRYSETDFVEGACNRLALRAVCSIIEDTDTSYSPLYIYGAAGTGKTHLLEVAYHKLAKINSDGNVYYIKTEEFTDEMVNRIHNETLTKMIDKYKAAKALILDDIQDILGKECTQQYLYKIIDEIKTNNNIIIMAGRVAPENISLSGSSLTTTIELGAVFEINLPDIETKQKILKNHFEKQNTTADAEILKLIAEKSQKGIKELIGYANRIQSYIKLTGKTQSEVKLQIEDLLNF